MERAGTYAEQTAASGDQAAVAAAGEGNGGYGAGAVGSVQHARVVQRVV